MTDKEAKTNPCACGGKVVIEGFAVLHDGTAQFRVKCGTCGNVEVRESREEKPGERDEIAEELNAVSLPTEPQKKTVMPEGADENGISVLYQNMFVLMWNGNPMVTLAPDTTPETARFYLGMYNMTLQNAMAAKFPGQKIPPAQLLGVKCMDLTHLTLPTQQELLRQFVEPQDKKIIRPNEKRM